METTVTAGTSAGGSSLFAKLVIGLFVLITTLFGFAMAATLPF